jgi:outer membrane immunogenic protein
MRKVTLGAIALCAAATVQSASAADLRMPTKAPVVTPAAVAVFSWTGFYIGAHVGWGWGETDSTILEADNNFFPQGHVNTNKFDGILGGGQIGWNYQAGQWVFGIEAQASWTDIKGDDIHTAVLVANRQAETHTEVNWVVTLTGRLGFAAGPALFYVKGGGAWADFEALTNSRNTLTGAINQTTSGGETRFGWTVGAGIEYALGNNWSVKGEYNFLDFGTERVTRSGTNFVQNISVSNERDHDTHLHIVK